MFSENKQKIVFLISGMLVGMAVTAVGGLLMYKTVKKANVLTRYEAKAPATSNQDWNIFVASSLDRIFQDGKTLVKPSFGLEAAMAIAQNEYESLQVVIQAKANVLKDVSLLISDLVHKDSGVKIDPKNILWRLVGYVPTKKPYYPVKYVGAWPDPLLPARAVAIEGGITQPFWVTIYIPPATESGYYQATITVKSGQSVLKEIPLSVYVYDFTLPRENHFKTAFDFYGHHTKDRYPQGDKESNEAYYGRLASLNEKFIIAMLKYRLNPILNIDPTSEADLGRIDRYRRFGLNNFAIGKFGGTFANNWPEGEEKLKDLFGLYRTYGEILKLNRMLEYTYIYTWDEGDIGNPRVSKICSLIHRAYPGLKNMVCYHGFWEPEKDPDWGKDIDIWCFNNEKFKEAKMRALQKIGKEIWMYISGPSGLGGPNFAIDFDSLDYRIVPWISWKYDIRGVLYWCVNWWPFVNPFKSAANTKWEQNGNGLLFYPGQDGPIASLRLEVIRDGLEDYEYLILLREKIDLLREKGLVNRFENLYKKANELLDASTLVTSMFDYIRDNETLLKRRDNIGQIIEEIDKILLSETSL